MALRRTSNLFLEVNKNELTTPGAGYAGLELKGVRFLNIALNASSNIEKTGKYSFAGFMLDYHTASGYAKRVALSVGVYDRGRIDRNPQWGRR